MTTLTEEQTPGLSSKTALDIMTHLHIVLKLSKVYEPTNSNFVERLGACFQSLRQAFQTDTEVEIDIRRDAFFVNKARMKFNVANYLIYKSVFEEFLAREIGTMTFAAGLDEAELGRFLAFLAPRDASKGVSFERLADEFERAVFPHIRLKKIPEEVHPELSEKSAIPIFMMGVYHLKDMFEGERKAMRIHLTRRWVQSLINHLISHESLLIGLTNIKNFQEYTLNHSVNVCILSLALGRRLGLNRPELIELGVSACLHDVGKFDIDDAVWNKPGKLDPGERALMEKHSPYGAGRLASRTQTEGVPEAAIEVALEHHIKPGLGGYPRYLERRRTHLYSRIVKVVDYYDAITTKRIYRPKTFTPWEALRLMKEVCAEEFDPLLFKTFAEMMGVYPVGTLGALDSGEVGLVIENNPLPGFVTRPLVKLITDPDGRKIDGPAVDLAEVDPDTGRFRRTILKTLDPDVYGLQVADYLIDRAQ
ncbi:MAG: HD domain-containing protein [Candidatus Aminicenantes bacterium]|nr:HD domain-containing protein [Candidatus Aminicenantes bacterium]